MTKFDLVGSARDRGGLSILLIEDAPADAELIQELLSTFGELHITHVITGEDGLAAAQAVPMDLVLLDLGLPGMTGAAVLRELLVRDPQANVVILSGNEDMFLARETLRRGALDYIIKSELTLHTFQDRVAGLLDEIAREKMARQIRGDFLSLVAHDLLGPIGNVIGLAEVMLGSRRRDLSDRTLSQAIKDERWRQNQLTAQ